MFEQRAQDGLGFFIAHAFDADGVARADEQRNTPSLGMRSCNGVRLRRQRLVRIGDLHRAPLVLFAIGAVA
jgi:hypothetical protein